MVLLFFYEKSALDKRALFVCYRGNVNLPFDGGICQNRKFPMVKNTNARIQSAAVRTVRRRVGFWFRKRRSRQKNSVTMPPRMHKASNASQ